MTVNYGYTLEVYRGSRDRFGDKANESLVGTIPNVVFQWGRGSRHGAGDFRLNSNNEETARLGAVVFAPKNAAIQLQSRDRVKIQGLTDVYQVVGDQAWSQPSPITGHDFGYYMMQVELVV